MIIAILEDNADRIAAMECCLAERFPGYRRQFFRSAQEAIAGLKEYFADTSCLCLDHDLEPCGGDADPIDPGDGRQVSTFLLDKRPSFPVVIHSSNYNAAVAMEADLAEAGWNVFRVTPFEDVEWIAAAWLPLLRSVIRTQERAH